VGGSIGAAVAVPGRKKLPSDRLGTFTEEPEFAEGTWAIASFRVETEAILGRPRATDARTFCDLSKDFV
jgi:hypothetical protein